MANIKIPIKEIEKHLKLTPSVLEQINLFGTPYTLTADTLEIEIYPNRPDLASMQGFLRAIKAYLGKEPGLKNYEVKKPEKNYLVKIDTSLKNVRPYTACAIVKGLVFNDEKIKEIIDLQEKLHSTVGRNRKKLAIGIYPLEKITLPIRFEARAPKEIKFIPLESDKEMTGQEILQRHPAGRDYAHLLEGLEKFPVFVDAKGKILSMPPVINSHETGKVSEKTKEVFIECSGFHQESLKKTLNILVSALADMGGVIYAMELDYGTTKEITPDFSALKTDLSLEHTNKLLGLKLKEKDLEKLLPKMGHNYQGGVVFSPAWRVDIMHEVDIIEDIAIAYGYNNFKPEIPKVSSVASESKGIKMQREIAHILSGLGLIELSTYHLIKEEELKMLKQPMLSPIVVTDSKTEYKIARPNLLIPLLRIFSENKDNEYPQQVFEMGTVFEKDKLGKSETGVLEKTHLLIALTPGNFTELKRILDYLVRMLGKTYTLEECEQVGMVPGRVGAIKISNQIIGFLGEVHPETLREWSIKMPVCVLEVSLNAFLL